jgi:hypothetical protein
MPGQIPSNCRTLHDVLACWSPARKMQGSFSPCATCSYAHKCIQAPPLHPSTSEDSHLRSTREWQHSICQTTALAAHILPFVGPHHTDAMVTSVADVVELLQLELTAVEVAQQQDGSFRPQWM